MAKELSKAEKSVAAYLMNPINPDGSVKVDMMNRASKAGSFDPFGEHYDHIGAEDARTKPEDVGKLVDRDMWSGLIFKGARHKTFFETFESEVKQSRIFMLYENRLYSIDKKEVEWYDDYMDIHEQVRELAEVGRAEFGAS